MSITEIEYLVENITRKKTPGLKGFTCEFC